MCAADVYDALSNERPYKAALSHAETVEHIAANAGTHFDPAVAAALERFLG